MSLGILVLIVTFVILLVIGVPIAYGLGIAATLTIMVSLSPLASVTTMSQAIAASLDSFTLLAIPFFVLAGQLMNKGGIAVRLIEFAKVLVGPLPGGLAFVNIIANMLFGAISGSAVASASAIGSIMHPRMTKDGYDEKFSAAVNISSATTGLIIPPSNVLIVYSLASGGVSIAALFIAGYVPGILIGLLLMSLAATIAYRKNYPRAEKVGLKVGVKKFFDAIPSLFMLVVVIGGIIAGIFTATEASAIAVLYALVLSFIYKEIKVSDMPDVLLKTISTSSIVLFLVGTSMALSWVMAYEDIPQTVSSGLLSLSDNPIIILLIINVILLLVGTFMDMTPAILIFTPIFLPIVTTQLGLDPIHFGIILILNLSVGICTPPVGTLLFVGCSVAKLRIEDVLKPMLPFFAVLIGGLLVITYVPELSLWLPRFFGFID
ncbi:MAG: TRAP transporter large permease [Bacteroidota bacterium]